MIIKQAELHVRAGDSLRDLFRPWSRADRPDAQANPADEQDGHGLRTISYSWANTRVGTAKNVVSASSEIFAGAINRLETQLAQEEEQRLAQATLTKRPK